MDMRIQRTAFAGAAFIAAFFMVAFPRPVAADHEPTVVEEKHLNIACAPVARIDHYLRSVFGAAPIRRGGLDKAAGVFQLYTNEDESLWAVTVVYENGTECMVLFGDGLEAVPWILRIRKRI